MADPLNQLAQLGSDAWAFITILSIAYGVLNCFFGYKIFKIVLGIVGFITGGLAAAGVAMAATKEPGIAVLAGLVGGAIGAVLMVALYFLGVFVLGPRWRQHEGIGQRTQRRQYLPTTVCLVPGGDGGPRGGPGTFWL